LAYTKNGLAAEVLSSDLPDVPAFAGELVDYVPPAVRDRFGDRLPSHPLRREIIATSVVNRVLNRVELTMVHRLAEESAASVVEVIRAHRVAWSAFGLERLWQATIAAPGIPAEVAGLVSLASVAVSTLEQVDLASRTGRPLRQVADVWFRVGRALELGWLRELIGALPRGDHWQSLARSAAREELAVAQSELVEVVLTRAPADDGQTVLEGWLADRDPATERYRRVIADARASDSPDLAQVSVALRELRSLIRRVSLG
jgi:NAD-specific glutamate dehydrogenase